MAQQYGHVPHSTQLAHSAAGMLLAALALLGVAGPTTAPTTTPTLLPINLPGHPFAFGCAGPAGPALLDEFTGWLFGILKPTARATLAFDDASGPAGWNGNGSASVYIKYRTPALYYQLNRALEAEQVAVLRRLDAAGIYNSFQVGEWGSIFHCLTPAEDPAADAGCGAWEHGTAGANSCGPSGYYRSLMTCAGPGVDAGSQPNCSSLNCSAINKDGRSACTNQHGLGLGRNPRNNGEANDFLRAAYQMRQQLVQYDGRGGGTHSTPGFSYYSHEPARWGAKLVGFEVGENIENAQTHVAIARGSSRQFGVPWHMQLSPWHGASETSVCADGAATCTNGGNCGGRDAGHSRSFLRRMFVYHWLAGSALNTAECCSCYAFDDGAGKIWNVSANNWTKYPAHIAQPNGQMLVDTFQLYSKRERGTPFAPLAIMMDEEAGFGGSVCSPIDRQQWGTFKHSGYTQSVYDLLNDQLLSCAPDCQHPQVSANLSRGETMQLRSSPLGEFYDVLQSDASPELLALYPAVLIAGEIGATTETPNQRAVGLADRLAAAAALSGSKLQKVMLRQMHTYEMGHPALSMLHDALNCSRRTTTRPCSRDFGEDDPLETVAEWLNPRLNHRHAAISDARLASLAAELNLVNVTVAPYGIQWMTNTLDNGDVLIYLANNRGVAKPACSAQVFDISRATVATVQPTQFEYTSVEEWLGDDGVHVQRGGGGKAAVTVRLGAGDAAILHFKVMKTRVRLKTDETNPFVQTPDPGLPSLKRLMPKGKHIGAAMHYDSVQTSKHADAAQYAALQQAQFGMAQDKNCMNWAFVEYKERGVFRWAPADSFVDWCQTHATLVRGHALVWGAHLPEWLLAMAPRNGSSVANVSTVAAAIRNAVNESVAAMVGRYRGRVYAWHAVMEAFGDPHWKQPIWKDNLLYRTFGPDYVGMVFDFARAADPTAKLCLLDYQISFGMYSGGVWDHAKADSFFGIVSGFKKGSSWSGNLDCVCMETHLQPTVAANRTAYSWLRRNFDRYASIGVEVHLNALTISINGFDATWSKEQKFDAQATWYQLFLQACVDSPSCVDFEPYGLTDKYDMGSVPIYSLPFDAKYDAKPAFWAMVGVLNGSAGIFKPSTSRNITSPPPPPRLYSNASALQYGSE